VSLLLRFLMFLSKHLRVQRGFLLGLETSLSLLCHDMSLTLKSLGCDQTLDLWCLGLGLRWLRFAFFGSNWPSDDILCDVIVFGQVEQLPDLASSLWSKSSRDNSVSQSGDVVVSLLDDDKVEDRQVGVHNASSDRLALALTCLAGPVAGVSLAQQKSDTSIGHDSLFHGESLFVVSTRDANNVTFPFITKTLSADLLSHSLLVEVPQLQLIFHLDESLCAVGWV